MKPTQEQVIAWAREAGLQYYEERRVPIVSLGYVAVTDLVRFGNLAYEAGRKDENEACEQIAHDTYEGFGNDAKGVDYVKQSIMKYIRARREQ